MYNNIQGRWYAVSSKRVNSHNMFYVQAGILHKRILNLSYTVELTKGPCHICQTMASTVPSPTAKLVRSHHIRMSNTLHSTLVPIQSGYLDSMEASVHATSTGKYVTIQHTVQLGSLHLVDIRILDI